MFFVLSKTLHYLTSPIVVIGICLLIALCWPSKKIKKRFFILGIILFFFFGNDFISNWAIRKWEIAPTPFNEINKTYRVGIVLTGVTVNEPELDDRVFFAKGADRVAHAVQLYKLGIIEKVMISGGTGKLINPGQGEAVLLQQAFMYMGVPEWRTIMETDSRNTYESAREVRQILEGLYQPEECLLITSAFHMRRARGSFEKAGWQTDTYSVDVYSQKTNYQFDTLFIPSSDAFIRWQKIGKEMTGIIAYKLAGYI
jgi:uncharacterized SAM-binding protein YcdF (DUF218 family)